MKINELSAKFVGRLLRMIPLICPAGIEGQLRFVPVIKSNHHKDQLFLGGNNHEKYEVEREAGGRLY